MGRYMPKIMNRLLVLLLPIFIVGCEIENDNRIGLGMKVDFLVTSECMKSAIEHTQNTQNLITNGSSFSFELDEYEVNLTMYVQTDIKTSFEIDIDGQHLDEDIGVFYRKTDALAKAFKNSIIKHCSNKSGI